MSDIPTELLCEIFKILSVHHRQSLIPLRLVCKEWRSIIDALVCPASLFIRSGNPGTGCETYSLPLHSLDLCSNDTTENQLSGIINLTTNNDLIGAEEFPLPTCDGLILIASCTRKDWALSFHGSSSIHSIPAYDLFHELKYKNKQYTTETAYFGLGYDASTSDYKVVRVARILGTVKQEGDPFFYRTNILGPELGDPYLFRTSIYSLKSQSWRRIQDFPRVSSPGFFSFYPDGHGFHPGGVFMQGALHWFAGVENSPGDLKNNRFCIVALDFSSESYRMLPVPTSISPLLTKYLDVLGGHLFLSCCDSYLKSVWILKDYGGENNWTKLATFTPELIHEPMWGTPTLMRPVAYVKSKEQVIIHYGRNKLMWVDVVTRELLKKLTVKGYEEHGFSCQLMPASLAQLNGTYCDVDESIALNITTVSKRKSVDTKYEIDVCHRPKCWTS